MKNIQNAAFVVSIHYGNTNEVVRINVKWKGNHEISDFNFDRFGEVLSSESETENTGWVVVRSSYRSEQLRRSAISAVGTGDPSVV